MFKAHEIETAMMNKTYEEALALYHDDIAIWKGWNDNTKKEYLKIYENHILPEIPSSKAISEFDNDDYTNFAKALREKKGMDLSSGYIEKILYLFGCVYTYGVYKGLYPDNLFLEERENIENSVDTGTVNSKAEKILTVTKSFTPESLVIIAIWIASLDPKTCDFRDVAFILMFFTGMRENETCGLVFGHVYLKCDGTVPCIGVFRSTKRNSVEHKAGGKTSNANRFIPIPWFLYNFIQRRKERLLSLSEFNGDINTTPIVSDDYGHGITTQQMALYIRGLFTRLEIFTDDQFTSLVIDLNEQKLNREDSFIEEKSLTAYVLRRNYATVGTAKGLTPEELQYVFGHEVEGDKRSYFVNDNRFEAIYKKIIRDPLFAIINGEDISKYRTVEKVAVKPNTQTFITIEGKEPCGPISYEIETGDFNLSISERYGISVGRRKGEPDIIDSLVNLYSGIYERLKAREKKK